MVKMNRIVLAITMLFCMSGCGSSHTKDLGDTITVDDVVKMTVKKGGTAEQVCPYDAEVEDVCKSYEDGGALVMYGDVENISSVTYDLSDIVKVKVILDGKYEYDGDLLLENDDRTEFKHTSYDEINDTLMQLDKSNFVISANFNEKALENASDVEVKFKISKNASEFNEDECKEFNMKLELSKE